MVLQATYSNSPRHFTLKYPVHSDCSVMVISFPFTERNLFLYIFIWAPLCKDDKGFSQYQVISSLDRQPRRLINFLIFFLEGNIYCLLSSLAKMKQKWSNQYNRLKLWFTLNGNLLPTVALNRNCGRSLLHLGGPVPSHPPLPPPSYPLSSHLLVHPLPANWMSRNHCCKLTASLA